jgi:hypothetical protein
MSARHLAVGFWMLCRQDEDAEDADFKDGMSGIYAKATVAEDSFAEKADVEINASRFCKSISPRSSRPSASAAGQEPEP